MGCGVADAEVKGGHTFTTVCCNYAPKGNTAGADDFKDNVNAKGEKAKRLVRTYRCLEIPAESINKLYKMYLYYISK